MGYDLLLKNGHVIDPKNEINEVMDIALTGGKIAAVQKDIPAAKARKVIDLAGLYVTPGIVDIHCHLYESTGMPGAWAGDWSVWPDSFSFRSGVTTMVDAGSSGWRNFADFRQRVIERVNTRVLAFVNVTGLGMLTNITEQNIWDMNPKATDDVAKEHSDVIVGIKTAHYHHPDWTAVDRAVEAGQLADLPVMVDFGFFRAERPYYKLVTERLRSGDITTHMYLGPIPHADKDGKLLDYLLQARQRGVKFDVGHGGGSFIFRNAVPSIKAGFYPDSISSDLHTHSMNGAMMDMTTVMSKFLAMGMPLAEIVNRSTFLPAQIIDRTELGHLSEGAIADLAVFTLLDGEFGFYDIGGGRFEGSQRLLCEMTFKDGKIMWDWNGRAAVDYRGLGDTYGIRDVDTRVVPAENN